MCQTKCTNFEAENELYFFSANFLLRNATLNVSGKASKSLFYNSHTPAGICFKKNFK